MRRKLEYLLIATTLISFCGGCKCLTDKEYIKELPKEFYKSIFDSSIKTNYNFYARFEK